MRDFADMAGQLEAHNAEFSRSRADRLPTAFVWRDPSTIPISLILLYSATNPTNIPETVTRRSESAKSFAVCASQAMEKVITIIFQ